MYIYNENTNLRYNKIILNPDYHIHRIDAQKVMNRQGTMVLRNVGEEVMDVFDITGFSDILTIE